MEQQQEETAASGDELSGIIEGITEQMAELTAAYNEAYSAALESVQGQYDLWDEAAGGCCNKRIVYQFCLGKPDYLLAGL